MKKTVVLLLVIILVLFTILISPVKATETTPTEENTSANLTFTPIATEESLTIRISTGTFEGLEEDIPMSASMTLAYDETNITRVESTQNTNWQIRITEETKRVLIESDNATSNTDIGQITFYFNQDVTEVTTGNVSIQEIEVSDGNLFDETYPEFTQSYTITPPQEEPEENQPNELPEININTETGGSNTNTTGETQNTNDDDNTVAPNSIPQTGISMGIVIGIVAIVIIAVVCFIKYRSIEIK